MTKKRNANDAEINVEASAVEIVEMPEETQSAGSVDGIVNTADEGSGGVGEDTPEDKIDGKKAGTAGTVKGIRRENGTGSVYPLNGGKGFGFCIQLTADRDLRNQYGNKLRYLGSGKTREEAEGKCADAIGRRDELLEAKLEKLGHKVEAKADDGGRDATAHEG